MVRIPDNILLVMTKAKASTVAGVASVIVTVPEDRMLYGGLGWFESSHPDDYFIIQVLAPDGSVVATFQDTLLTDEESGWYFKDGFLEVKPIKDGSMLFAGLKLNIIATKGDLSLSDTLRCNINWGLRV